VGFTFYLLYAELINIDNIYQWCTGIHVITLALFAVVSFGKQHCNLAPSAPTRSSLPPDSGLAVATAPISPYWRAPSSRTSQSLNSGSISPWLRPLRQNLGPSGR
jgi:hypothetical protein